MAADIDRTQQHRVVIWSAVMTTLGTIAVILRVISRLLVVWKLGWDDCIMIFFTGCYVFEILYSVRFGIGLHGADLTPPDMVALLKIVLTIQLTYPAAMTAIKISILCFYIRLAVAHDQLRRLSRCSIVFIVVFFFQTEMVTILQSLPIDKFWDLTGQEVGNCVNVEAFFYFVAGFNVLIDIWVLTLPIKVLKDIQLPTRDKVVLFIIFGFGAFSCISGIVRLYTIKVFTASDDPFYDSVPINIWSMIEINIAIICASVPALKPLFARSIYQRTTVSQYNDSAKSAEYGHQIMPPGDDERNNVSSFRDMRIGNNYIKGGPNHNTSSEDHLMPRN